MFCPECKAEYRQGFTHCSDCDADLVYELPSDHVRPEVDDTGKPFRLIWKGYDQAACVAICRELMKADLPYKVARVSISRESLMRATWEYDISVPDSEHARAKELLGVEGEFTDDRASSDDDERPSVEADEAIPADDAPTAAEVRNDSYLDPWYPEDATVEIWSQDGDDISSSIEMALSENLIHCRLSFLDGDHKVFVLPEDEARARGIVREIVERRPLN